MTSHPAYRRPMSLALIAAALLIGTAAGQEPGTPGWTGSNTILVASRHLIHAALARPTQRTTPINETFDNTVITGVSFAQGNVGVELIPNDEKAHLNVVVLGVITTKTTGPATARSHSTTRARFPLRPASRSSSTKSGSVTCPPKPVPAHRDELLCIDSGMKHKHLDSLVKQFARQAYYDSKPRAEKRQAEKAQEAVERGHRPGRGNRNGHDQHDPAKPPQPDPRNGSRHQGHQVPNDAARAAGRIDHRGRPGPRPRIAPRDAVARGSVVAVAPGRRQPVVSEAVRRQSLQTRRPHEGDSRLPRHAPGQAAAGRGDEEPAEPPADLGRPQVRRQGAGSGRVREQGHQDHAQDRNLRRRRR